MRGMDLDAFRGWLQRYFDAWASNDPVEVSALFAEDAMYSYGPFREETHGREAIVRAWVEGGVPTELRTDVEPIAVAGDRGVAHWRQRATKVPRTFSNEPASASVDKALTNGTWSLVDPRGPEGR